MKGLTLFRASLRTAFGAVVLLAFIAPRLDAAVGNGPQEIANAVFGNLSTAGQIPPPGANYFAQPIPIGMGARALGMGEAFTGLANDISAIWWNPAGLVNTVKNEVQWMGGDRNTDAPYTTFFAANYMLQNHMNFALSYERPYNPVGAYPDVVAGYYPAGSAPTGYGSGPVGYTGTGGPTSIQVGQPSQDGTKIPWYDIPNTSAQAYLAQLYREYINPAYQDDTITLTYATPLTPDDNLSLGVNVKYYFQDHDYAANNVLLDAVGGYGVDLGVMYNLPLEKYGRDFSVGLNLHDLASQVRFNEPSGSVDSGREITLPTIATLGLAWQTNDYFTRHDLNLTADYTYINDPAFSDAMDHRFNVGGEMWFFKNRFAARAGYEIYFDQQMSRPTLGLSFRTATKPTQDGLGIDYAYMFPAQNETSGMNWVSVSYFWGGIVRAPVLPEVSVSVDPPIFDPRNGDTATFTLQASSPKGIDRWSLSIIDRNNQVVKVYQDRGDPPAQIVWGGEDRQYRLLPDGQYTYLFTATDHDGNSSSTPVQTLKIYTPPSQPVVHNEIDKLRRLIAQQDASDEVGDQQARKAGQQDLQNLVAIRDANQALPPIAKAPVAPPSATSTSQAMQAAGSFGYPHVNDVPFPKTSLVTDPDGKRVLDVQFQTQDDQPRAILREIADVAKVSAGDVGVSVARYDIRADYGTREIRVVVPASAALSLSKGFITPAEFIDNASVTLDGAPLSPTYQ